jgi:hypothetical protein
MFHPAWQGASIDERISCVQWLSWGDGALALVKGHGPYQPFVSQVTQGVVAGYRMAYQGGSRVADAGGGHASEPRDLYEPG